MNSIEFPDLDFVVIGINTAATLGACLSSILNSDYPQDKKHIYYVDGGSTDGSKELAACFQPVKTILLEREHPTPGAGRNAGWRAGSSPFVFFIDSDTEIDPWFPRRAMLGFSPDVAAVQGLRVEKVPGASLFNWIGDQEWQGPAGLAHEFGGDVIIRREVLEATDGYNGELIAGEDPELSQRIRQKGWQIVRLNCLMTIHDLGMMRLGQYWRRAYRSGYAYASVRHLHHHQSDYWKREAYRIHIRGGLGLTSLLTGLVLLLVSQATIATALILIGTFLLAFPLLFRLRHFRKTRKYGYGAAIVYALHCSVVVIPQWFGMMRFHLGHRLGKPLRNAPHKLQTGSQLP